MSIQWRAALSVSNPALDAEHKKIVAMINALESAEGRPEEERIVKNALAEMGEYVLRHFRAEEDAMSLSGYQLLEPHRKTHNDFAQVVRGLTQRTDLGARELRAILTKWLTEHIMKIDKDYAETVAAWVAEMQARKKR